MVGEALGDDAGSDNSKPLTIDDVVFHVKETRRFRMEPLAIEGTLTKSEDWPGRLHSEVIDHLEQISLGDHLSKPYRQIVDHFLLRDELGYIGNADDTWEIVLSGRSVAIVDDGKTMNANRTGLFFPENTARFQHRSRYWTDRITNNANVGLLGEYIGFWTRDSRDEQIHLFDPKQPDSVYNSQKRKKILAVRQSGPHTVYFAAGRDCGLEGQMLVWLKPYGTGLNFHEETGPVGKSIDLSSLHFLQDRPVYVMTPLALSDVDEKSVMQDLMYGSTRLASHEKIPAVTIDSGFIGYVRIDDSHAALHTINFRGYRRDTVMDDFKFAPDFPLDQIRLEFVHGKLAFQASIIDKRRFGKHAKYGVFHDQRFYEGETIGSFKAMHEKAKPA
jgi:hypothetical protein